VGANSVLTDYGTTPALHNIAVTKNGFIYIYCSNESPVDVFFDNLQVMHTRGPILEETHYYPFGLTMAGISSKAAGGVQNRNQFNGGTELQSNEFSDASGLELYGTQFRSLDPQIGRFLQLDPLDGLSQNISLYSFASNNPILRNDPLGLKDSIMHGEHVDFKELPDISYAPPKKLNIFSWPAMNPDQGEWSGKMFIRQRDGEPLVQGNEPPWILNNLDFYKRVYQNDIDYRKNQVVAVLILLSPLILEIAPELLSVIQEQAVLANQAVREVGIDIYGFTNLLLNKGIASTLQAILRILPESMPGLSKLLTNLANKPMDLLKSEMIYEIMKKILERQGYKGLPSSSDIFPVVKLPTK